MGVEDLQPAHQEERQATRVDPMDDADDQCVAAEKIMRTRRDEAQRTSQKSCRLNPASFASSAIFSRAR